MSFALRMLLVLGAVLALAFVIHRIRKSMLLMGDAIFWVALTVLLVILAIFPGIAITCSQLLGFISPSNFVFLFITVLLMAKMFANSSEISMLKHRVNELAQEEALFEKRYRDAITQSPTAIQNDDTLELAEEKQHDNE